VVAFVQELFTSRGNYPDGSSRIGQKNRLWYDSESNTFRISDGETPGGIIIGGGGGDYFLPTASTTVKGGVKIDGTTIAINNQIISIGTVPYSNLSGTPTIPTNTNQLTNGAGFITSSALSTYALSSSVPTNNNQLSNGAGYITSAALSGYATETYVTTRGYLTAVSWNDVSSKPTFATVATSGSYADLTNKPTLVTSYTQLTDKPSLFSGSYTDLTNKPTIPTDINQLTDVSGLLGQGGGGGTTVINNTVENTYSFNVAADDSTLREINNGETLRFAGATGITISSDAEGKITITGPDLSSLATQTYVTSQGYITSSALTGLATETYVTTRGYLTTVSYNDVTNKPTLFSGSYTDLTNKPTIPTNTNELTNGAGYITSSSLTGLATEAYVTGRGYITSSALTGLATESYVTSRGYITGLSWNQLTDKPNLTGTYSFNVAADDSTLREISSDETVKFVGAGGITTSSDDEGKITITGPNLSSYALTSSIPTDNNQLTNGSGYITSSALTGLATESYVTSRGYITGLSWNQLTDKPNLAGTYSWSIAADDSAQVEISAGNLVKIAGGVGISTASDADGTITITGFSGSYNDLTDVPTTSGSAINANGTFSMPLLGTEPTGLQAGQIALANGTTWDPLSKGNNLPYMTIYSGSSWIEIGGLTTTNVYSQILELM
jgi:hypothetical protein